MTQLGIIPDEWLISYAAGALSEAKAMIVASHCDYHPQLQKKMNDAENIGAALMLNHEPMAVSDDLFDNLMHKIDQQPIETIKTQENFGLPYALANYIGKPLSECQWKMMGPGLSQVKLWQGPDQEKLWLLKAKPGAKIPPHDHNGLEMTLILQGSYHIGKDCYTKGMLELADDDIMHHTPMIDEGEECICLVVTEAPLKLHNFVGRMLQPFIGL